MARKIEPAVPHRGSLMLMPDGVSPGTRTRASFHEMYFSVLMFAIAAYAMTGKGFAYAGIPPIFPGEVILAIGLCTLLLPRFSSAIFSSWIIILLLVTIGWVILRTLPFIRHLQGRRTS